MLIPSHIKYLNSFLPAGNLNGMVKQMVICIFDLIPLIKSDSLDHKCCGCSVYTSCAFSTALG